MPAFIPNELHGQFFEPGAHVKFDINQQFLMHLKKQNNEHVPTPHPSPISPPRLKIFICVLQALQTSGEYEEAYDLCLMAQKVVDESVEKGDGMGPAHDPHVLWLQLASSSFFLQRWSRALEVFTRIVEGVTQVDTLGK